MKKRKYAIFLGIILIVAGTIACGGKDTASEKDRIKEIEVYDDDNESVTIQEKVNFHSLVYRIRSSSRNICYNRYFLSGKRIDK